MRAWDGLAASIDTPSTYNAALLDYQTLHRELHGIPDPNAEPWE